VQRRLVREAPTAVGEGAREAKAEGTIANDSEGEFYENLR
jgi:hypothetical protein